MEKKFPVSKMKWLWINMEGYHGRYILGLFGTVTYNVMQLTVPFFSGKIVDMFLSGENAAENLANHMDWFFWLVGGMVGFTVLRCAIVYLTCMAFEHGSQGALYRIRNYLFDKIERQDMKFYSTYRTGDLMTRVTGDLDAVRHMIAWVIRMIIESFVLAIATSVYFFVMDWRLALSILAIAPFIFIVIRLFRNKVAPRHKLLREKFAKMNTMAQENISGNRVVKAFAREEYEKDKFDECNQDYRDTNEETSLTWVRYFPAVEIFANALPVILLIVGGLFLINGSLSMGDFVAFSGLTWAISNPMRQLGNIMNEFQRFNAASTKVMEIYYSEASIRDPEEKDIISHSGKFKGRIEFDNVSFAYDDEIAHCAVLHNISFTAEPGQTIAIMGETGCGKTSLIQLIPRFYDPVEGSIKIDGTDIRHFTLKDLRANIGLATQDVLLYSDTIDGNIAYGDANLPKAEVVKYARTAVAADFIAAMPEGYETIIGERGVGLSGGQKQRISLARALAIKPSILILDDTTSAVDLETEKEIQEGLAHLDFECTKIIIAQRISTTKNADRILIMRDGRIVESGTHEELCKAGGYYSDIVKLQLGNSAI